MSNCLKLLNILNVKHNCGRALINKINSKGPKLEPCGTPEFIIMMLTRGISIIFHNKIYIFQITFN